MSRIFISYRRDDSAGWTGRLVGYLKDKFGADSIFSDIDTIEPGADFTDAITRAVGACDVLLAVIGPRWLIDTDTNKQRRLDDPADWVRTEITAALNRKIRVIPVLVGKAGMPAERELPPEIKALAERQAHELSDKRWEYDCQRLATMLEKAVRIPARGSEGGSTRKKLLIGGLALTVIILMGIAMTFWNNLPRSSPSTPDDTLSPPQARNDLVSRPPIGEPLQQPTPKQKTGSAVAQYPINLRANQEVRLAQTNSTYKILSVELDRSNSSTLLLRFNIRLTNNSGGTTLFWNDSFRLLVEGVPRAPISSLSTTVAAHSAKEGTVEFTTPDTVSRVVLQLMNGSEQAEIPIDLTETSPKPVVMSSNPNAKLREAQFPMHLRANQEVRLAQTNSTYKILSVELDRSNSSTLLLRFNIRLTNNSGGTTLFWNDSFRLLVEGVPRAPISSLSTTVAAHSAKDGTVEFTTPDTVSRVVLQFRYGDESAEIPIDLTSVQL